MKLPSQGPTLHLPREARQVKGRALVLRFFFHFDKLRDRVDRGVEIVNFTSLTACERWSALFFGSCKEKEIYFNKNGVQYPFGVKPYDLTGLNDCTLGECSSSRITRLVLDNVRAIIAADTLITITLTFDTIIHLKVCGDKLSGFEAGDIVLLSGICKYGCGYLQNVHSIEENYYLAISENTDL